MAKKTTKVVKNKSGSTTTYTRTSLLVANGKHLVSLLGAKRNNGELAEWPKALVC